MPDTLDKISEQLTRLEVTVATEFHKNETRFGNIEGRLGTIDGRLDNIDARLHEGELRDMALSRNIDVNTEALRGDVRTVLDAVHSLGEEMRRTTDSIRKEHAADREVLTLAIEQHAHRLHKLETK